MRKDERDQDVCRKALHWIALGNKNFGSLALCEAISIPDDQDIADEEHLVEQEWISRSCSSLIHLADQEFGYPIFELAHFTVKEYLRSISPQSKRSAFRFSEDLAIRKLMGTSLRFLTFPLFERMPTIASSEMDRIAERNEQHPFYPVAAAHVFCHTGEYWDGPLELGEQLSLLLEDITMMRYAEKLFSPEKKGIFLSWVLQAVWYWPNVNLGEQRFFDILGLLLTPEFTCLHMAAALAVPSICTHLLESNQADLNSCALVGTPLHALLAGPEILAPQADHYQYKTHIHFRSHPKTEGAMYKQSRRCLEVFLAHGADTSLRWSTTTTIFQMAINCSIRTANEWIYPLIIPSTMVTEDCLHFVKRQLATRDMIKPILNAIVTVGSGVGIASQWARLASLIQPWRVQAGHCEGDDLLLDLDARILKDDFTDIIRILLSHWLTDLLRVFVQDPRFRPDMFIAYNEHSWMPVLHCAIRSGSLKSVELLLEAGCAPQVVDESDGWTSLHQCAVNDADDAPAITKLMLESGVSDSVQAELGETCWHIAAEQGNVSVLKVLLDMGENTGQSLVAISSTGRTPLAYAVLEGEIESALLLLAQCHARLEYFQSDQSLLDRAAAIGSFDLFLQLHDKLGKADAAEAISTSNPLDHIDMDCSPELADFLLTFWTKNLRPNTFISFLIRANRIFSYPDMNLAPAYIKRVIQGLLPAHHTFRDSGKTTKHVWEVFCEIVLPCFSGYGTSYAFQRHAYLVGIMFDALIDCRALASYERNTHLPCHRVLFRALLSHNVDLKSLWIVPSIHKVLIEQSLTEGVIQDTACIELFSRAMNSSTISLIRQLLDYGVDLHFAHGRLSLLEQACCAADLLIFELLLQRSNRSQLNKVGSRGRTLLHWVVAGQGPRVLDKIEKLVQLDVRIDAIVHDRIGDTALTLASRANRQDIVALLVALGANTRFRARDGWTLLHAAAITGDLRYVRGLLSTEVSNSLWLGVCEFPLIDFGTEPQPIDRTTVIHLAASRGRDQFLEYLIQRQVPFDVNAVTGYPMLTPIHLASWFGHIKVIDILVSCKVNVNARDAHGLLPIELAAQRGHLEIFKKLLECGSERPSNRFGDMVAGLMSKKLEFVAHERHSWTMASFYFENAIANGDLELCQRLVHEGLSVNAGLITRSHTPLVRAVIERQTAVVDWLVSVGVEVTDLKCAGIPPALRCIAALTTHYIPCSNTLRAVLSLALKQNVSWYGSVLSPIHVAILDNKMEALEAILCHIRRNENLYRYENSLHHMC